MSVQGFQAEILQAKARLPAQQKLRWQPVPEAAVDLGAAPQAATLHVTDGHRAHDGHHAAVAVELVHSFGRGLSVAREGMAGSFFQYDYIETGFRQSNGRCGTAGASWVAAAVEPRALPPSLPSKRAKEMGEKLDQSIYLT